MKMLGMLEMEPEGTGNRESIAIEIAVNEDGDYNKAVENARKLAAYLMGELNIPLENVKNINFGVGRFVQPL